MAEVGSLKAVFERIKEQRERVVILILLLILIGLSWNVWGLLQQQRTDEEGIRREILRNHGYADQKTTRLQPGTMQPDAIADRLLDVPDGKDIVKPLIEVDPLRPREDIQQIRQRIGGLMQEAANLMDEGKWADAIVVLDQVNEIDPAGVKYDYREGTPRDLLAVCRREQTRDRMVQAKAEADRGYDSGMEQLKGGNRPKARDILVQARRDYEQILDMDPDRAILDEGFYTAIDARIEELNDTTRGLIEDTLLQDIASKREKAKQELAAYQQNPQDLASLAGAKEVLIDSLDVVDSVDPDRKIIAASQVEEIESLLKEVEAQIANVVPGLMQEAEKRLAEFNSTEDPKERMVKGEAALGPIGLLRSLVPEEPSYQETYTKIQEFLEKLRRYIDANRAKEIIVEAKGRFQRAREALRRNDMTAAASEKEAALAVLDDLRSLPQENIGSALAEAEDLRRQINVEIRSLPLVTGVEVTEMDPDGKWVRLRSQKEGWADRRHMLNTRDPRTHITPVEIKPSPAEGAPYVVVKRDGFMDTKITEEGG